MSVEEIKEFMEEQRKRFSGSGFGSDDDYDDYYDNDAEIDYGDDPNDEDDAVTPSQPSRIQQVLSSPSHQIQVRIVLKNLDLGLISSCYPVWFKADLGDMEWYTLYRTGPELLDLY